MYSLRLFGGISLEDSSGAGPAGTVYQRSLAVLALLAVARDKGCSREKLIGYLWAESDQERARHRLSDTVYMLRKSVGDEAVVFAPGDILRLNPEVIESDAGAFLDALEAGELETATGLYDGPFLDGFYTSGAPEFERWAESERQRFAGAYANALEQLAEQAEAAGDHRPAVDWWKQLAAHDPYNSRVVLRLMQALAAAGDPANALEYARVHELRLREELGIEPPGDLRAYVERLRAEPVQVSKAADVPTAVGRRVTPREVEPERKSIAVLPFANMSADPENEYFSDGITEEIINALSKLRDLRIAARTSSFTFKGKSPDIQEVGAKLQVATVLEGSVRKAGNKLRITARLINVADGYRLWSERYDREMDDVFAIQDEISAAVVDKLKVSLLDTPELVVRGRHTDDLEAYELYLRGRYFSNQRGAAMLKGLEYFEQAVARDPEYAPAHAGMADALAIIGFWSGPRRHDVYVKGKAAARRALELDPMLAEAHACLGLIAMWYDWDWALAERELLRAIELDPQDANAHLWYGMYLANVKVDWDAAIQRLRHARELDPLSVTVMMHLSAWLIYGGCPEEGLVEAERALELAPDFFGAHWYRGIAYRRLSRYEEATDALKRAMSVSMGQLGGLGDLALTHARAGRLEEAQAILDEGVLCGEQPVYAAAVYALMGRSDAAFELLETAYEQRDPMLPGCLRWHPDLNLDRDDPRYQDLLRRLALP